MKRKLFLLFITSLACATQIIADDELNYYCSSYFDEYRSIRYWAMRDLSIFDYDNNYDRDDCEILNLKTKDINSSNVFASEFAVVSPDMQTYYNSEFNRIFCKNIPFYDVNKGKEQRNAHYWNKYSGNDNIFQLIKAEEDARINALYGPKPGGVFCRIRVSRYQFPVLYEIQSCIVVNDLDPVWDFERIQTSKLGYSSPEYIISELKQEITRQLEQLASELKKVNTCKNN